MKKQAFVLFFAAVWMAGVTHAAVYKHRSADGQIVYSDAPVDGAETLELPPLQRFSLDDLPPRAVKPEPPKPQDTSYSKFEITKPAHDAFFTTEVERIDIELLIIPELRSGDKVRVFLNDIALGDPERRARWTLPRLDRGTYTLYATIINEKKGRIATTPTISIHQFRTRKF